ncbi:MAG: MFS transporter, partial [Acidimicrobiia bacterium]|nr:MFS transporter [Acidimicrobiia bacterium]
MRSLIRRVLDPLLPAARFTAADKRIVWVIWVAGLIQGFAQSQATVTLPFTRTGLGLSEGEMSLLLGLARLAAFAALPLGWLGDHRGRRRPLLLAVTLVVVGGAAAGLALDAWQFGVLHGILRTGTAAMSGLAVVLLAEKVSLPIRAYAISFFGASVSLGAGLALITLPLAEGSPDAWRTPHLLVSVGFLLLPFLIKNVPESEIFFEESQRGHWRELVRGGWSRRFWTVLSVGFLSSAFGAIGAGFSTARLIDHVGLSTGEAIWILLGGGTAGGLGFFIGGKMADTIGRRKTTVISLLLALAGGLVLYTSVSV